MGVGFGRLRPGFDRDLMPQGDREGGVSKDDTERAGAFFEAASRRLRTRSKETWGKVNGVPKDADAARDLSERDKHEFQKWIVATIGGRCYKGGMECMDREMVGHLPFRH